VAAALFVVRSERGMRDRDTPGPARMLFGRAPARLAGLEANMADRLLTTEDWAQPRKARPLQE